MSFDWRTQIIEGADCRERLLPLLVPAPPLDPRRDEEESEQEEEDEPGLSWIPRHSIEYRGLAGDVEEFLKPPLEDWRLVEGRIPPVTTFPRAVVVRMARTLDIIRAYLANWTCQSRGCWGRRAAEDGRWSG